MPTKLGRMITFLDGLLTIKSHGFFLTWHCKIGGLLTKRGSARKRLSRQWLLICCKTKLKKKIKKIFFLFFTKYTFFGEKNFLFGKKGFIMKNYFTETNFFYREKYKLRCKKYISHLRNIFLYRKCFCDKYNINLS